MSRISRSSVRVCLFSLLVLPLGHCGEDAERGTPGPGSVAESVDPLANLVAPVPAGPVDSAACAEALARGKSLFAARRVVEAQTAFDEAVQADPTSADAQAWLGRSLVVVSPGQSPSRGIVAFRNAYALDPDRLEGLWGMGLGYFMIADHESARRCFERCLADPAHEDRLEPPMLGEVHYFLGVILTTAGRAPEALAHFDAARQRRPDFADVSYQKGLAYEQLGDDAHAIECYETAASGDPSHLGSQFRLARLYARQGDAVRAARAREIHRLLNELTDNTAGPAQQDVNTRMRLLEQLTTLQPENHAARLQHVELLLQQRQEPAAMLLLDALLGENVKLAPAYYYRAELALRHGDRQQARSILAKLRENLPDVDPRQLPPSLRGLETP